MTAAVAASRPAGSAVPIVATVSGPIPVPVNANSSNFPSYLHQQQTGTLNATPLDKLIQGARADFPTAVVSLVDPMKEQRAKGSALRI
jgi:hypothetical protein